MANLTVIKRQKYFRPSNREHSFCSQSHWFILARQHPTAQLAQESPLKVMDLMPTLWTCTVTELPCQMKGLITVAAEETRDGLGGGVPQHNLNVHAIEENQRISIYNGLKSNQFLKTNNCPGALPVQKIWRCHCILLKHVYDLNGLEVVPAVQRAVMKTPWIVKGRRLWDYS